MSPGGRKVPFGTRKAAVLQRMPHKERLDLVAEGLPVILRSANSFWSASLTLSSNAREAQVLANYAEEEAAKALILVDLARCPPLKADDRVSNLVKMFYNHLSRLIFAKAQSWQPTSIKGLQEYVDTERQSHYLEGGMSEYILPNWLLYSRESRLYADIEIYEDERPHWNDPTAIFTDRFPLPPYALDLANSLQALGVFSRQGLTAASEVWGTVDFNHEETIETAQRLTMTFGQRLEAEKLFADDATEEHVRCFFHRWQMPMYNIDFSLLAASLEDLEATREAVYWSEVGY